MKFIVLLLLSIHLQSYCQNLTFPVDCSDSLLMTIKGKYTKGIDNIAPLTSSILPKAQQPEALRRMDAMHKLLLEAYPQPLGMDGRWGRDLYAGLFADDVNYSNGIPVCNYMYRCTFCSNTCHPKDPKEVSVCADVYNHFRVYVNQMGELQSDIRLDTMTINGRKVYMLNPLVGSWKGMIYMAARVRISVVSCSAAKLNRLLLLLPGNNTSITAYPGSIGFLMKR